MAFKLTKAEITERESNAVALEEARAILDTAREKFNNDLESMRLVMQDAVDGYNGRLADAREFRDDLVGRFEDEINDKSDKWQEGDAGNAAAELVQAWQALELDDIEVELPEDIEIEDREESIELRDTPNSG